MLRSCCRCIGRRSDGLMWNMELKPHHTGDYSMAVVQANSYLEDQTQVYTSHNSTFIGVYDGHGGPQASHFVNSHLFYFLHKYSSEHGLSVDVIKKAFSETEAGFLRLVKRSISIHPKIASVGSCCLVGVITNNVLFVANLGDSRAVLGRRSFNGKKEVIVAERLSTDHNVSAEEIRKEVEEFHPDDAHIVEFTRGVWRIKGIIQVSRSIGDVYFKKPELSQDPIFQQIGNPYSLRRAAMSAEPHVLQRKLEPEDLFLIFASDGLWEHLSDQAVVEIVSKNPRSGIAKRLVTAALQEAAKKRELSYSDIKNIEKGIRRHFHDDISVVVVYLDHEKSNDKSNTRFKPSPAGLYTNAPADIFSFNTDAT